MFKKIKEIIHENNERKAKKQEERERARLLQIEKIEKVKMEQEAIHYNELMLRNAIVLDDEIEGNVIECNIMIIDDDINFHSVDFNGYSFNRNYRITNNAEFEVHIGDYVTNYDKYVVIIFNECLDEGEGILGFLLDYSQIKKLESFYEIVNNNIRKRQLAFKNKLILYSEQLDSNEEIKLLCKNFIRKTNQSIFCDLDYIISFERFMRASDYTGIQTLWTFGSEVQDDEIFEEVRELCTNEYIMLLKLITNKGVFDDSFNYNTLGYVVWYYLRSLALDYFAEEFNTYYGYLFNKKGDLNLADFIYVYTEIETIDHSLTRNLAMLTYFLMKERVIGFNQDINNYMNYYQKVIDEYLIIIDYKKMDNFEKSLLSHTKPLISINDIDLMNGYEFEVFISDLFFKMGYGVEITKSSGDQGVDIILTKNNIKLGVQTKCYSAKVGNKAIQEVIAGIQYYKLDKGIVVTNNFFTKSATELAQVSEIVLWDRDLLKEKINETIL